MNFFNFFDNLLSKNGIAVVRMARELLSKNPGDRMETVEFYAKKFSVGRGTIQYALRFLTENEVINFETRGHLGTFLLSADSRKLLEISGIAMLSCSMPLPYSRRYEGLATGLYAAFEKCDIPFSIGYTRGSLNRIQQLKGGKVDFVILSSSAAALAVKEDKNLCLLAEFDDYSYVGRRIIIFREQGKYKIEPGMRIGVDNSSYDHVSSTKRICKGVNVEFVNVSYAQLMNMLKTDTIDAATWNGDELIEKLEGVNIVEVKDEVKSDMRAAILGLSKNKDINNIVKQLVNKDEVQNVQQKVIKHELIPNY